MFSPIKPLLIAYICLMKIYVVSTQEAIAGAFRSLREAAEAAGIGYSTSFAKLSKNKPIKSRNGTQITCLELRPMKRRGKSISI